MTKGRNIYLSRRELQELSRKKTRPGYLAWLKNNCIQHEIHEETGHPLVNRRTFVYPKYKEPEPESESPQETESEICAEPTTKSRSSKLPRKPWRKYPERWVPVLFYGAKKNAKQRGINFDMTMGDMLLLVSTANGRCMLTGIEFEFAYIGHHKKRPWAPSLDRIDSDNGYSLTNCRLVCAAVNLAMNEWGEEPLRRIARALVRNERENTKQN